MLLGLVGMCSSKSSDHSGDDKGFAVSSCKDAVKSKLKDPDSAKFGDDWSASIAGDQSKATGGGKMWSVSGSVNAKNGFGGYTGAENWRCDVEISQDGNHSSTRVSKVS